MYFLPFTIPLVIMVYVALIYLFSFYTITLEDAQLSKLSSAVCAFNFKKNVCTNFSESRPVLLTSSS